MGEKKNNTSASNLVGTVKEEVGAAKADAANAVKKVAGKVQGAVQEKKRKVVQKEGFEPYSFPSVSQNP